MSKKTKQELLDEMAELEIKVLIESMKDPETCTPAMLANVRRFLSQNKVITQPETEGVQKLVRDVKQIPDFSEYHN